MKLSSASAIILAASLLSGEKGLVQAKNAKEFQERRRNLLRKKNTNKRNDDALSSTTTKYGSRLDMEDNIMPMQKESRQDYIYLMGEGEENTDINTYEEFGGEVPMFETEEEEGGIGMPAIDGYENVPFEEGRFYTQEDIDRLVDPTDMDMNMGMNMDMYMEEMDSYQEDMGMTTTTMDGEEEAAFEEGRLYTQEDIDWMVDTMEEEEIGDAIYEVGMEDKEGYDYEEEDLYKSDAETEQEEYEYMLEEEELYAKMGLNKEAAYQAALMEEKFGDEDAAYELMLEEEEMYAEMGLEDEPAYDAMMEGGNGMIEEKDMWN